MSDESIQQDGHEKVPLRYVKDLVFNAFSKLSLQDAQTEIGVFVQKTCKDVAEILKSKDAETIVQDHAFERVFKVGGMAQTNNITNAWWWDGDKTRDGSSSIYRTIVGVTGPSHLLSATCDPRHNPHESFHQGLLCTKSNWEGLSPIEQTAHSYWRSISQTEKSADEMFKDLLTLFTSKIGFSPVDNEVLNFMSLDIRPTGKKGNRTDIINILHLSYLCSLVVYMANTRDFAFFHPARIISNVFVSQINFFPYDSQFHGSTLTDEEKKNYLMSLGHHIYEYLKEFYHEFFLNNSSLFPYQDLTIAPPTEQTFAPPTEQTDVATSTEPEMEYFLFGNRVDADEKHVENDQTYKAIAYNNNMKQVLQKVNAEDLTWDQLYDVILMIFPKDKLKFTGRNFGFQKKSNIESQYKRFRHEFFKRNNIRDAETMEE